MIVFTPTGIDEATENELKSLKKELDSNKSNFTFRVTWINSSLHKDWVAKLGVENPNVLNVRVLRTGRRIKYIEMSDDFNAKNVLRLVEKILGGDTRSFTLRNGLPEFAQ